MSPGVRLPLVLTFGVALAASSAAAAAPPPVIDTALSTVTGAHFVLRHRQGIGPAQAAATLDDLEAGLSRIGGELGLTLEAPVEVLLLAPPAFAALTGNAAWVRGSYDGRILLPVADGVDASSLRPLLLHELTHALLRRAIAAPLPPWLEEGLAERAEGNAPEAAAAWLRDRRAPAFAGLDAIDADIRAAGWREDAGHQRARLALQGLEEVAGADAPARLLAALRSGRAPAQAVEAVVPGGVAALESRLRAGAP